jgi:hypothetical protein
MRDECGPLIGPNQGGTADEPPSLDGGLVISSGQTGVHQ